MERDSNTVYIFTDGSGDNRNKKNGGYGYVLKFGEHEKHVSSNQYINTNSARMELRGILESLKEITNKTLPVKLYCDNQYCIYSISKGWVYRWEGDGWYNRLNSDLWKAILIEYRKFKIVPEFIWIKGHSGNRYNEIADCLADKGRKSDIIIDDTEKIINL